MSDKGNKELHNLIDRLHALQLEQATIIQELRTIHNNGTPNTQQEPESTPFAVGDRVRFTNNHRGERGLTGIIVSLNPKTASIRTEKGHRTKKHKNIKKRTE